MNPSDPTRATHSNHGDNHDFYISQKRLFEQGSMQLLLANLRQLYGHINQCYDPENLALAIKALSNLGLTRDASALFWRSWRRLNKPDVLADFYYHHLRRRGSHWQALLEVKEHLHNADLPNKIRSDLWITQAELLATYRDFTGAEEALDTAEKFDISRWSKVSRAYLKLDADLPSEALAICKNLLAVEPNYRPAIQFAAHIYHQLGDSNSAISLLENAVITSDMQVRMQSFSTFSQLIYLYIEQKKYSKAEHALTLLKTFVLNPPQYWQNFVDQIEADLLCAQQKYEDAIKYLSPVHLFTQTISERIKANSQNTQQRQAGNRTVLETPYERQNYLTCAPASLTTVANYFGANVKQQDVIDEICYAGTPDIDERRWARDQGWLVKEFELNRETAVKLIDAQIPFLFCTVEPGMGHLQVLVGYDEATETYIIRDPNYPRLRETLIGITEDYYSSSGPRCMVMIPPELYSRIEHITLPASELYDHYFELKLALDNHQRANAYQAYRKMLTIDAKHRLTLFAKRALAGYDFDDKKLSIINDQLLERYPNDVNLILAKAGNIAYLKGTQELLKFLEPYTQQANCHYLILNQYLEYFRRDARYRKDAEKSAQKLLKYYGAQANILTTCASLFWESDQKELACEAFRLATCLEDKQEQYAHNYFVTAQKLKKTQTALDFLQSRFDQFQHKSSGPALSLYSALAAINREQDGLEILNKAVVARPGDGYLLIQAAEKHLQVGQHKECLELLKKAEPVANRLEYLQTLGAYYTFIHDYDGALKAIDELLVYEPLNRKAYLNKITLLKNQGKSADVKIFVNELLKSFPDNLGVLATGYQITDKIDHEQRREILSTITQKHPEDPWAYIELSQLYVDNNDLNQALLYAQEAVKVAPQRAYNYVQLGRVYLQQLAYEQAQQALKKAIELSADETEAFDLLLATCRTQTEEKESFTFILTQLMTQTTEGYGVLRYLELALNYLDYKEIALFLKQALNERPDLWQVWIANARFRVKTGEQSLALELLNSATERFPLNSTVFYLAAESCVEINNLTEAEAYLNQALIVNPLYASAINLLSDVLLATDRISKAIDLLENHLKRQPHDYPSYAYLADIYLQNQQKQIACEKLHQALEIEPEYAWAWQKLALLAENNAELVKIQNKLTEVRKSRPGSTQLALSQANIEKNIDAKLDVLRDFLQRYPHNADVAIRYCEELINKDYIEQAQQFIEQEYWRENQLADIQIIRAQLNYQTKQPDLAFAILEDLLSKNPSHRRAWEVLLTFYSNEKNTQKAVFCADKYSDLIRTEAENIAYIGVLLNRTSAQVQTVEKYYQHALELNRTSGYIFENYSSFCFDQLNALTSENNTQPKEELESNKKHWIAVLRDMLANAVNMIEQPCFLWAAIRLATYEPTEFDLLSYWDKLLGNTRCSYYYLSNTWNDLNSLKLQDAAITVIENRVHNNLDIAADAGVLWADGTIKSKGLSAFEKNLPKRPILSDFDHRVLEGYLRYKISNLSSVPEKILTQFNQAFADDATNWSLLGELYARMDQWYSCKQWMRDYKKFPEISARTLYIYGLSELHTNQWQTGKAIIRESAQLERDDFYEDILCWILLFDVLEGKTVDYSQLDNVDYSYLSSYSQYIYTLLHAIEKVDNGNLESTFSSISHLLRNAQANYQNITGASAAVMIKEHARRYLESKITSTAPISWYWRWRLGNHF